MTAEEAARVSNLRGADIATVRERGRDRFWRDARRRRLLAAADVLVAALVAATLSPPGEVPWSFIVVPAWVVVAKLLGLYDLDQRSIRHLTIDELPSLAAWTAIGIAGLAALGGVGAGAKISFGAAVIAWPLAAAAAGFARGAARWVWRRITPPERTAVLGDGELAAAARRKLEIFPDMHLQLFEGAALSESALGDAEHRRDYLHEVVAGLDRVIVASEGPDLEVIGLLSGVCRYEQVKLNVVSPLRAGGAPRISEVADLPILEYDTRDVPRSTVLLKRGFDLVAASCALAVLAPFYPLVALAVRLDSRGSSIFRQRRAGQGGAPFTIFKLRTMQEGADLALGEVVEIDSLAEPVFKLRRDPRVTRFGRFLRRFSLDELPQLVNVVRGEMSIVGPRPEQIELVDRYSPEHRLRLGVKPGMTGPMQVSGRGELTFSERLAVELDYVENLSIARDLSILLQTIPAVIRGTGAF
jgi:exopolysaccharide biosynthesis polyprenyl glycosylphosphotransferase